MQQSSNSSYNAIGLMSGSSMDGLDICYCNLQFTDNKVQYKILKSQTNPFPNDIITKLQRILQMSVLEFSLFDRQFGAWIGEQVNTFITSNSIKDLDYVASHGHTVLHKTDKKLTVQIGNPAALCANAKTTVIADFRSLDVALNGQGAPLVPIGDRLLFGEFDFCLNLGGIANISYDSNENKEKRIAYDICPMNIAFNHLASQKGLEYDKDGLINSQGSVNEGLLKGLLSLEFFSQKPPKSLGREWVEDEFLAILDNHKEVSIEDKMRTCSKLYADEISKAVKEAEKEGKLKMLCTGGGAYNKTLIQDLSKELEGICEVCVPDNHTVEFKEALIFALLGALRIKEIPNCLSSVTGAVKDNIGGCIYKY